MGGKPPGLKPSGVSAFRETRIVPSPNPARPTNVRLDGSGASGTKPPVESMATLQPPLTVEAVSPPNHP
jgi:hypothetical protein